MNRSRKESVINTLEDVFSASEMVVVAHYKGMTVAELADLRAKLRQSGSKAVVAKNTLARRVVNGKPYANLVNLLEGQTLIVYSKDPLAAAKTLVNYAKDNEKLAIRGAVYEQLPVDVSTVKSLATLPSLDELRATLVRLISTPATRIAGVLQAPAGQLARVLNAHASKNS